MEALVVKSEVFKRMRDLLGKGFSQRAMARLGVEAVNFSKERFIRKDWFDQVHDAWEPRARKDRGSLMVRTGRLKRSIRKISSGDGYVIIGTYVPYAAAHNNGERTQKRVYVRSYTRATRSGRKAAVKSHTRQMNLKLPKRQFMGPSMALTARLKLRLQKDLEEQLSKLK